MSQSQSIELLNWQKKAKDLLFQDIRSKFGQSNEMSEDIVGTFIPGPPGTGKTFLINHVVEEIQKEFPSIEIHITATTGAAATRLKNAITLATWLQVGSQSLKLDKRDEILREIEKRQPDRIKKCDVLVIDEASMLSQRAFDNLNELCKNLRKNPAEFGGIYVIILGDPFQLPPVPHDSGPGFGRIQKEFVPSCLEKQYLGYKYVVANQMKRAEDREFAKALLSLVSPKRENRIQAIHHFRETCYQGEMEIDDVLDYQVDSGALVLTPVKNDDYSVNAYNSRSRVRAEENPDSQLIQIMDIEQKHKKEDENLIKFLGGRNALEIEEKTIKDRETWPSEPEVRTKQPYMIRLNFNTLEGISVCNGDIGEIVAYHPSGSVDFLLYRINKVILIERQDFSSEWCDKLGYTALPLIPASATTIHKAQGATVSCIVLDGRRFNTSNDEYLPHKIYTALSRVRRIENIKIASYILDHILDTPKVQEKLEMIWKMKYMRDYLTPESI